MFRYLVSVPLLLLCPAAVLAAPAKTQPETVVTSPANPSSPDLPSPPALGTLDSCIDQLVEVLNGEIPPENYFDENFLSAVPPAQFKKLSDLLITQYGKPLRIMKKTPTGRNSATLEVAYEKGVGTFDISVSGVVHGSVSGLLIKGFTATDDSMEKIGAEFAALPGRAGYVVQELGSDGGVVTKAGRAADQQFAIGSTFKLYILAELASQIESGARNWTDVEPLSQRSFSSTGTQGWPKDSPATLHTLATWMISVSDNSATDTLLHVLGRSNVEQKLALVGHSDPDKALPFLSTVEAFALKSPANADLRDQFLKASEAEQRALLEKNDTRLGYEQVDSSTFGSGPAFIDTLEWFASPTDIARLMNNIRRTGNQGALDIMAVNKAVGDASAKKWQYLGYKGGSEPGVMSMSFLGQTPSGKWMVVSGSWNDTVKALDESKFAVLMSRLLDEVAE